MMTQPLYCTMDITVGSLWLTSTASKPLGYALGDSRHFSPPLTPTTLYRPGDAPRPVIDGSRLANVCLMIYREHPVLAVISAGQETCLKVT